MSPAQLELHQLAIADHLLQVTQAPVQLPVVGVQQFLPGIVAQRTPLRRVVAQLRHQVIVAEQHATSGNIVHIQQIGHGTNHFTPEMLTLDQGQLAALAAADVTHAQGDRIQISHVIRQIEGQPQVARLPLGSTNAAFHGQVLRTPEQCHQQLQARRAGLQRTMVDQ